MSSRAMVSFPDFYTAMASADCSSRKLGGGDSTDPTGEEAAPPVKYERRAASRLVKEVRSRAQGWRFHVPAAGHTVARTQPQPYTMV
jgi:hypothetical protein